MSFDVFLQTHNYTGETRSVTDPWTGKKKKQRVDAGVSKSERRKISDLLSSLTPSAMDEFGCIVLELKDGGSAEVYADELHSDEPFTGCMFSIRSAFTPQLLDVIWRVCNFGRMSMLAAMEDGKAIVTDRKHLKLLPKKLSDAVVCESPEQLGVLLERGFAEWDEYRQQVTDD